MTTVVSILLSDMVPLRDRGTWQGYVNIIFAFGAGLGAPLGAFDSQWRHLSRTRLTVAGGILADSIGWRW